MALWLAPPLPTEICVNRQNKKKMTWEWNDRILLFLFVLRYYYYSDLQHLFFLRLKRIGDVRGTSTVAHPLSDPTNHVVHMLKMRRVYWPPFFFSFFIRLWFTLLLWIKCSVKTCDVNKWICSYWNNTWSQSGILHEYVQACVNEKKKKETKTAVLRFVVYLRKKRSSSLILSDAHFLFIFTVTLCEVRSHWGSRFIGFASDHIGPGKKRIAAYVTVQVKRHQKQEK